MRVAVPNKTRADELGVGLMPRGARDLSEVGQRMLVQSGVAHTPIQNPEIDRSTHHTVANVRNAVSIISAYERANGTLLFILRLISHGALPALNRMLANSTDCA